MSDRLFFASIGTAAAVMIALALVWPQGLGRRSPGPFGHRTAETLAATPALRPASTAPAPPRAAPTPPSAAKPAAHP